jgi:hypothetical protein
MSKGRRLSCLSKLLSIVLFARNRLTARVVGRLLVSRIGPRYPDWSVSLIERSYLSNENCEGQGSIVGASHSSSCTIDRVGSVGWHFLPFRISPITLLEKGDTYG